jgi:LPPG:FO 2-phospho-L-lactate transferase
VLCPSNPLVSLGPILALPGVREKVAAKPSAAVTPIIGGRAVKGPLAKMLRELGRDTSAVEAAREYRGVARGFLLDRQDSSLAPEIKTLGLRVGMADTLMADDEGRKNLAMEVLRFIQTDRSE